MGYRISDLQKASVPLNGSESFEIEQGGSSRQVSLLDLLPGFDSTLSADLLNPIKGVNLIGFKAAGDEAVARTLGQRFDHIGTSRVEMIDDMTDEMLADIKSGEIPTVDCYPAFVKARARLGIDGGVIVVPGGSIGSSAEWQLYDGMSLEGSGGFCHAGATTSQNTEIVALHSGRSILSVVGANGCRVRNLTVKSYPTAIPKTGILAGRSGAASAGQHYFDNVSVFGHYTTAAIYSIASEVCIWAHTYVWLFGGGAKYCFYTSSVDDLSVGGLTSSTNIGCTLIAPHFLSFVDDTDSSCMFMKGRYDMGSWRVMAGYFIPYKGSYLTIDLGPRDPDGNIMLGSLDFDINGEMMAGGDPKCGVRIKTSATSVQPFILRGFRLNGGRFDTLANTGGDRYGLWFDDNIIFENAYVFTQPATNFPYATNRINRKNIVGGNWAVGRDAYWAAANLASGASNTYGGSYAPAATSVDSTNTVKCRGSLTRSALGDLFALPAGLWPPFDMFFTSGTTRIRASSTTGMVTATAGDVTQIDLSVISFCLSRF